MNILEGIVLLCLLGITIVVISSIIDNKTIKRIEYNIKAGNVSKKCKIVFLSDLHGNKFGDKNSKLISMINDEKPDLILIGGDMITATKDKVDSANWDSSYDLLLGINKYPIYYGVGNHEYRMNLYREDFGDAYDRYTNKIEQLGVKLLNNEQVYIGEFNLIVKGLSIDRKYYKRFEKRKLPEEYIKSCFDPSFSTNDDNTQAYNIMLAHNPEYFEAYSKEADLTLSGHVHGGIVKLPLLGGVISPRLSLFPKYDGGLFDNNKGKMIISRGLGSHTLPFRVFNPCELVVINLDI